mmetsp:Transcript_44441/g.62359  ORF Transcript_44441/g.62359 Transcript_44441/m.62359 type:complete len:267 (+) Transcript_44441:281-1081(+)
MFNLHPKNVLENDHQESVETHHQEIDQVNSLLGTYQNDIHEVNHLEKNGYPLGIEVMEIWVIGRVNDLGGEIEIHLVQEIEREIDHEEIEIHLVWEIEIHLEENLLGNLWVKVTQNGWEMALEIVLKETRVFCLSLYLSLFLYLLCLCPLCPCPLCLCLLYLCLLCLDLLYLPCLSPSLDICLSPFLDLFPDLLLCLFPIPSHKEEGYPFEENNAFYVLVKGIGNSHRPHVDPHVGKGIGEEEETAFFDCENSSTHLLEDDDTIEL